MSASTSRHLERKDWLLFFIPSVTLLIYVYYTLSFVFFTPYPGLLFTSTADGWRINDSTQPELFVGDIMVQIGELTFSEYQNDRHQKPFAGTVPGSEVAIVVQGNSKPVSLSMPPPTVINRLKRAFSTLGFFPFWAAGTAVLLFLRPRDQRWWLLLIFMYLIAIWVIAGVVSSWRIGASRWVLGATFWFMAPIFIHLHLVIPTTIFSRFARGFLPVIYFLAIGCSVLEFFQFLPPSAPLLGALLGVSGSIALLIYRLLKSPPNSAERVATRLMLTGIGLAFLPGILYLLVPEILNITTSTTLGLSISQLAIPILPFFYIYAVYKRQLGVLEFRTNRLISIYSFVLLYPPLFLLLVLSGNSWIQSAADRTIYLLVISTVFVIATPPLLGRFQHWINRLAYGTEHDPAELVRIFANQAPSAHDRATLIQLIKAKILPSLLIRQSCMVLLDGEAIPSQLYTQQLKEQEISRVTHHYQDLLDQNGFYQPPRSTKDQPEDWVRLTILLKVRDEIKGLWLFGRRDPDDYYPQADIGLLNTLANQIAPLIENIQLYEFLQKHAQDLAEEVADRTAELQAERDRTQAILDSAGEGIFFTDPEGSILYANPQMYHLTGYVPEEFLGKRLLDLQAETVIDTPMEHMLRAMQKGEKWEGELKLQRKDGQYYDTSLTIAPLCAAGGQIDGFVGVQSDISKFKEIDRLKTNIIANVSHELRTPLTNIRMYLELVKVGKPEKQDQYFKVLEYETNRLTRLIGDLLDISKLDSGEVIINLTPTDLLAVMREVVTSSQRKANIKKMSLRIDEQSTNPPAVLADGVQLDQVFTNLVTNAINYGPMEGVIKIRFGTGMLADQPAVWVAVEDNGPGITAEDLPHLFDRFYRGQAGQMSTAPGTGLGLAISQEIIKRHHGQIEVASEFGLGTTFTVWLLAAGS